MAMIYLRLENGLAVESFETSSDIYEMFPRSMQWRPAEGADVGWRYEGGQWSPPAPAPAEDLFAYAADRRWKIETGGVSVGGVLVATDDRSKVMIMGARIKADADPDYVVGWKGVDGSFVELSAPQIIAISDAVLAHVDACFAAEASVAAAITAGAITATQQVDDWPWPG